MTRARDNQRYGRGHDDGLDPLTPLDLAKVDGVDALVRAMSHTAFGGRRLGEAADVLEAMIRDRECYRVLTISGAMTIAKQGLVICEMIDRGWVNAIVCTGALMTHGLSEGAGLLHFKHKSAMRDEVLYEKGYNRVYDTIELEQNLDDIERILSEGARRRARRHHAVQPDDLRAARPAARARGARARRAAQRITTSGVPVFVPAFTDCELGLDVAIHNHLRRQAGKPALPFDPFHDLDDFAARIREHEIARHLHDRRRRAAQLGAAGRARTSRSGAGARAPTSRCAATSTRCGSAPSRITGAASPGCSYTEGVSWGKFVPEAEGGRFAEVYADATIAWPLVVRAVMERISRRQRRKRPSGRWMRSGRLPRDVRSSPRVERKPIRPAPTFTCSTRVRFRDADGEEREFFASIVELGPRSGRIESAQPLEKGCPAAASRGVPAPAAVREPPRAAELRRARAA